MLPKATSETMHGYVQVAFTTPLQLALFISQLQRIYPRYKYVQGEFLSLLLTHFPTQPVRSSAGCRAPGLVVTTAYLVDSFPSDSRAAPSGCLPIPELTISLIPLHSIILTCCVLTYYLVSLSLLVFNLATSHPSALVGFGTCLSELLRFGPRLTGFLGSAL